MPVLTVGATDIHYVLRRSAGASRARLTVTPEIVEVVVPTSATYDQIHGVLHRRRKWLYDQTQSMAEQTAKAPMIGRFASGAKILYRGRLMRLTVEPSGQSYVEVAYRNGFVVACPRTIPERSRDALVKSALRLWLRKRLAEDARAFIREHGEPNSLKPKAIRIKDQKHLWGSCGRDRVINLNWHLIFAPKPVLEYAVVHELCHVRHRNHDSAFWRLVGSLLPDWKARKAWLETNEHLLTLRRISSDAFRHSVVMQTGASRNGPF